MFNGLREKYWYAAGGRKVRYAAGRINPVGTHIVSAYSSVQKAMMAQFTSLLAVVALI